MFQSLILEPLQHGFMQRALLAALLVGLTSGVMGAYVVTRGMSFLGDALAHSVLPGVATAFITGNSSASGLLLGGLVAGTLSAIVIAFLTRAERLQEDTAIGIVFAATMALGIALISSSGSFATDLQHALVGNIFAVQWADLGLMAGMSVLVLLLTFALYKEFLLISFDQILARSLQLPHEQLRVLLLVMLAITIVIGVQAVGIALVAAALVTPTATARFFVKRLQHLMALAVLLACSSAIIGLYLAWHLEIAPSATIVLTMSMLFALAFFFAPQTGYVWSHWGKR